jgi:hypothetical protein
MADASHLEMSIDYWPEVQLLFFRFRAFMAAAFFVFFLGEAFLVFLFVVVPLAVAPFFLVVLGFAQRSSQL